MELWQYLGKRGSNFAEAAAMIEAVDRDKSGSFNFVELLHALYPYANERDMNEAVDRDKSGSFNFVELLHALYPYANERDMNCMISWTQPKLAPPPAPQPELSDSQKEEITSIFKSYDKDQDGLITVEEFYDGLSLSGVSQPELLDLFHIYDKDSTSSLSLDEFFEMMKSAYFGKGI
eukprot:CAMPEP_0196667282 /NCGR_PEP_ID=MMETSP1086-20130531/64993_1 /TAXON_ID=77921 /ORGANISM="Cyanoptyche  gloeocystis , Strain SAG4.97" /LENGTH=176 /DNA_ID=CAMNT_0042004595 /DNA_START=268 /DNA_END=798 /DNA_ORIENTATION=-